jgi:hypothetical protein
MSRLPPYSTRYAVSCAAVTNFGLVSCPLHRIYGWWLRRLQAVPKPCPVHLWRLIPQLGQSLEPQRRVLRTYSPDASALWLGNNSAPACQVSVCACCATSLYAVACREGLIYIKDAVADIYGCVSIELLENALVGVIQACEAYNPVRLSEHAMILVAVQVLTDSRMNALQEYKEIGVPCDELVDGLVAHPSLAVASLTRGHALRHISTAADESIIFEASFRRYKLTCE